MVWSPGVRLLVMQDATPLVNGCGAQSDSAPPSTTNVTVPVGVADEPDPVADIVSASPALPPACGLTLSATVAPCAGQLSTIDPLPPFTPDCDVTSVIDAVANPLPPAPLCPSPPPPPP